MKSVISRHYKCGNDCCQTGCPGHTITLTYHHTSDTVNVSQDGKSWSTFDKVQWRNLVNMDVELRKK